MKNTTTLFVCTLAVMITTACDSSFDEPATGAALPDEFVTDKQLLSEAARDADCPSEIQGFEITLSDTMTSADTLKRVGGACVFGEAAYQAAHSFTQGVFVKQYCNLAQEYADKLGGGDYARAHQKVVEHVEDGYGSAADARPMLFALSGCASSRAKSETAASMVSSTSARIYSVGTYTGNGKACDGILWSQGSSSVEQHYRLTGLNGCTLPEPPISGMFHPKARPEGRLLGNYFREDLGYTGDIPEYFRYKGQDYPFHTPKPILTRPDKDVANNVTEISDPNQDIDVENTYAMSVEGNWACSTANPDGTVSRDVYVFSSDGRLLSSSNGVEVRGRFSELDGDLDLHFTSVKRSAKVKKVDVRTKGQVKKRAGKTLDFITFDAKTQEKRQVSCIQKGSAADHEIAEASLPNSSRERPESVVAKQSDTVQPRIQAAQPAQDFAFKYAMNLADQMEGGYHPACSNYAAFIRQIGSSASPTNIRMMQVDKLVDKAPSSCFR